MAIPKVAVAIPSYDMVHADFAMALALMAASTRDAQLVFVNVKYSVIAAARNYLVAAAQRFAVQWVLFLDSDMIFPSDLIPRLLAHDKDIVGGVYRRRSHPTDFVRLTLAETSREYGSGLVEMAMMPTGCLMIRASVFDSFTPPIFRYEFDERTGEIIGEDYSFSKEARSKGYRLFCDVDLSKMLGHIGQRVWSME